MKADILWKHNESAQVIGHCLSYDRKTGEAMIELNAKGVNFIKEAQKLTREDAIEKLKVCLKSDDTERAHAVADDILIELLKSLGYADVVEIWEDLDKWYA